VNARRPRRGRSLRAAVAIACLSALSADAECVDVRPVACERCFAVFVMPDIQSYVRRRYQPQGAAHLDLVMRYVCAHRERWQEPRTGKTMPILMLIQLGDLVHGGAAQQEEGARLAEWVRVDAAFDRLDECDPPVPYLVTLGNHDLDGGQYQDASEGYDRYFGVARWADRGVQCADPARCDWPAGEYFIGGGDPILAHSRNHLGPGPTGPMRTLPGRHRAGVVGLPGGGRMLFLGLELAFDFPPAAPGREGLEGDDARWPLSVLAAHRDLPTLVFHHSMLWTFGPGDGRVRFGPETWGSDSLVAGPEMGGTGSGMRALFERLVEPHPQGFMLVSGHVLQPAVQADFAIERAAGPPVQAFLRNYQSAGLQDAEQPSSRAPQNYGVGWNVIAAFDPDAGEVRVRSYRIDDVASRSEPAPERRHRGEPAATECLDMDQGGVGERAFKWPFGKADDSGAVP